LCPVTSQLALFTTVKSPNVSYFVYILECEDGSLYTGTTNDIEKRFAAHMSGKGANYTRSHKPKRVVYSEELSDKSEALKREIVIKKLTRAEKLELIGT
jgi:putative endonuclease